MAQGHGSFDSRCFRFDIRFAVGFFHDRRQEEAEIYVEEFEARDLERWAVDPAHGEDLAERRKRQPNSDSVISSELLPRMAIDLICIGWRDELTQHIGFRCLLVLSAANAGWDCIGLNSEKPGFVSD